MKFKRYVLILFVFHILNALYLYAQSTTRIEVETKLKRPRLWYTQDEWRTLIIGDVTDIVNLHKYNVTQPLTMRYVVRMMDYIARMKVVNPAIHIPNKDEINRMAVEEIENIKKTNPEGLVAEKMYVAEFKAQIHQLNNEYSEAIEYYQQGNYWRNEFINKVVRKKYNWQIVNRITSDYLFTLTRIEIIKSIITKKEGKKYETDLENYRLGKRIEIYDFPIVLQNYFSFLIAFNRKKEFKELVDFELARGPDYNTIFYCNEISNIYFDWFDMHTYWLTDDFKILLKELRKKVLEKTPCCY